MMNKLLILFDYGNELVISKNDLNTLLTIDNLLIVEDYFIHNDIDTSNIYFKLLYWLFELEKNYTENKDSIAYINYIIGTYISLYFHPTNSKEIGLMYIEKAINLESDLNKINLYNISKTMLNDMP